MADWYLPCLSSSSGDSFWASCAEAHESSQKTKIKQIAMPDEYRSAKPGFDLMCDISTTVSVKAERCLFSLSVFIPRAHDFGLDIKVFQTSQRDLRAGLPHHLLEQLRDLPAINESRLPEQPQEVENVFAASGEEFQNYHPLG